MEKVKFENRKEPAVSATILNQLQDNIDVSKIEVIESILNANNGCIRYSNGLQIAWSKKSVTTNLVKWENLYYSDHELGNWVKPFSNVFTTSCLVQAAQFWTSLRDTTTNNLGTVRLYRPNNTNATVSINIFAIGTWK